MISWPEHLFRQGSVGGKGQLDSPHALSARSLVGIPNLKGSPARIENTMDVLKRSASESAWWARDINGNDMKVSVSRMLSGANPIAIEPFKVLHLTVTIPQPKNSRQYEQARNISRQV